MNRTRIEWVRNDDGSQGYSWNPVVGCKHGCPYCYAHRFAERGLGEYGGHPKGHRFDPRLLPERLWEPVGNERARTIFVCSMADLLGDWVPREWVEAVLETVGVLPQRRFLFLTKNPRRYAEFDWPENCWLGTTCENQAAANERIPHLLVAPAAHRFVSLEPLLGTVDPSMVMVPDDNPSRIGDQVFPWNPRINALSGFHGAKCGGSYGAKLDWVICGGQTGSGAKQPDPAWVDSLIDQCRAAKVPVFAKNNLHMAMPPQEVPWL